MIGPINFQQCNEFNRIPRKMSRVHWNQSKDNYNEFGLIPPTIGSSASHIPLCPRKIRKRKNSSNWFSVVNGEFFFQRMSKYTWRPHVCWSGEDFLEFFTYGISITRVSILINPTKNDAPYAHSRAHIYTWLIILSGTSFSTYISTY